MLGALADYSPLDRSLGHQLDLRRSLFSKSENNSDVQYFKWNRSLQESCESWRPINVVPVTFRTFSRLITRKCGLLGPHGATGTQKQPGLPLKDLKKKKKKM